jgi:signal transduction histidine kinase
MNKQFDALLKKRVDLVLIGAVFGLMYWLWQSFRDSHVLGKSSFIQSFLFPDMISLAMRLVIISVFLLLCIHAKYLQEKMLEKSGQRDRPTAIFAFIISAIGFIMLYWIFDSFQDIVIEAKGEIVKRVLTPEIAVLLSRFLSVLFLVFLIFLIQYLFRSRQKSEKALKAVHNQLVKSRENLSKIVSNDLDAVFVLISDRVVFVNPAAERLYQKPVYEFLNKPLNLPIKPGKEEEFEIINELGETYSVEAIASEIEWEGETAVMVSLRDITERKRIERIRQHFLSLISHRLKSPVVGIMGAIDNMLGGLTGNLSEKQREYLLVMHENITAKYHLIEDLLTVLRLEARGETVQMNPVVLEDVINHALNDFRPVIQKKNLQLDAEQIDSKLIVRADAKKLEKTIRNILHNAVKFTAEGSIRITAKADGERAMVKIEDTGQGMSDTTLKTLFHIEKKVNTLADANIGVGFGMYMAKKLMLLQGGDLIATSTLGKESCFTLYIPLHF